MNLIPRKNFLLFLAAVLVVAFGYMSVVTYKQRFAKAPPVSQVQITDLNDEPMSSSDSPEEIEKDLEDTDLTTLDKELQDMEVEINGSF